MIHLAISIAQQTLQVLDDQQCLQSYPISSAKNGTGCDEGSYCTPTGNFIISEKHGHGAEPFTIFKGRKAVGVWTPDDDCPDDLVTTRILWLDGCDSENANTKQRYIYIHGTNHEDHIGSPASCGCIRMRNHDIIEVFDLVDEGCPVTIH